MVKLKTQAHSEGKKIRSWTGWTASDAYPKVEVNKFDSRTFDSTDNGLFTSLKKNTISWMTFGNRNRNRSPGDKRPILINGSDQIGNAFD